MQTQMIDAITVFSNPEFGSVRTVKGADGEPLFVAKDVAEALGYVWKGTDNIRHIPEEWRGVQSVWTPSGEQEMLTLSEQGLYFFLGRSDKDAALPFQKWLAGDVVPSLRKTGSYGTPTLSREDILTQAIQIIGHENEALNRLVETLVPKADFADAISDAEGGVSVNRFAKILSQHGVKNMGSHRLYKELRRDGFIIQQRGKNWNTPKQKYMEKGWFRVIEYLTDEDDSLQFITTGFRITGKGQQALLAHFMDKYGLRRQLSLFERNRNGWGNVMPASKREALTQ